MKQLIFTATFCLFLIFTQSIQAQQYSGEPPIMPFKTDRSVLFGKDIVINNLPDQNQQKLTICSAPNGWLYAAYTFDSIGYIYFSIMRSKDNGLTWNFLYKHCPYYPGMPTKKLEIIACGDSVSDQKVFIGWVTHYEVEHMDYLSVLRYKGEPFIFDAEIFYAETPSGHDISLANDQNYPAVTSNPGSVGFIYSITGAKDSIIFRSSSNGGLTFNNRKVVAVTTNRFHKVTLGYGVSFSQNTGRYFAAWEEQADSTSNLGHIYTSHSNPDFNSPFTTPVKLDGLDPSLVNLCRNPVIACQANNVDNDSTNLSEVVLFEKFNLGTGDYDVTGFYNKKAATANAFTRLNIAATPNNELQPAIAFNSYDSTFMVTYFDSTAQKLPFLSKNLNLANPDNWNVVSTGYNDSNNLKSPGPKIKINYGVQKAMNIWTGVRSNDNGVAFFDAPYIPATGILQQNTSNLAILNEIFPNPCNTFFSVSFELKVTERVTVTLYNLVGEQVGKITDRIFNPGLYTTKYDISEYPSGSYFFNFLAGKFSTSGKICLIK